jgi:hypothetical protein
MTNELVVSPSVELVKAAQVPALLAKVRPQWQSKNLIERVRRLLEVDPSSACQRLLNAAIHDLRDKVIIAGIDIAREAAQQFGLPPIEKDEDVSNYSTYRLIDLAYRMGLLTRPEWRRVCRCYEIRRDLEHEDDEYEAGVEDCVYIFITCIEVILAIDPVHLIRVTDIKDLVEQANSVVPDEELVSDFDRAPEPRQEEILKFLVNAATDREQSDIVQQNAFKCLTYLKPYTRNPVLIHVGNHIQEKIGRRGLDIRYARVAYAAGILPYLRRTARRTFFGEILSQMEGVGVRWTAHQNHGEVIRPFMEVGSFEACPDTAIVGILKYLVLTYIGEPGGQTSYGNIRHVFYSNSAEPLIRDIVKKDAGVIQEHLLNLADDDDIEKRISRNQHVARRFDNLLDIVDAD